MPPEFAESEAHERACRIWDLRRQNAPWRTESASSSAATAVLGIGRFLASRRSVVDAAIHGRARAPRCRSERSEREQWIASSPAAGDRFTPIWVTPPCWPLRTRRLHLVRCGSQGREVRPEYLLSHSQG